MNSVVPITPNCPASFGFGPASTSSQALEGFLAGEIYINNSPKIVAFFSIFTSEINNLICSLAKPHKSKITIWSQYLQVKKGTISQEKKTSTFYTK